MIRDSGEIPVNQNSCHVGQSFRKTLLPPSLFLSLREGIPVASDRSAVTYVRYPAAESDGRGM